LVDGDLRKPVLHTFFFQSHQRGLTDYVLGEPLERVMLPTAQPNLWLLPTGPLPPDPSDFLGSAAMETRFKELVDRFDLVLFDAPPIGLVSDVMNFAQRIDAILYLAPLGREKKALTLKGVEMLKLVAAPVIGLACNFVNYYEPITYKYGYTKYTT
ncbi:MAG TPA: CpsD/CapB family tyrosine-protein kinase, partial [Candidatus Ozemobacteraceae bacterium]|nr:CpsD/CapB family tyrosine-protein kinase [Candidatus Ozemobacteraceae bacterium]